MDQLNTSTAQDITQTQLSAEPSAPHNGGMGLGSVISVVFIAAALIAAIAAILANHKSHRMKTGWAIFASVFAALAMLVSIVGMAAGTIIAKPEGDPQQTASEFMDAVISADYDAAYALLDSYSSLGLENEPADEVGKLMYAALKASYSYELSGSCMVEKLEARQQIQFTYLNLPSMTEDITRETTRELEEIVKNRPARKVYDENKNYLPQVADEAYTAAVKTVLSHAEDYYETSGIQLQLNYSDSMWKVIPAQSLIKALSGGTAK